MNCLGLVGEPVRQVLAFGAAAVRPGQIERREIRSAAEPASRAADVDVESLLVRREAVAAQVPFADARRSIARRLQRLGERDLGQRQLLPERRVEQLSPWAMLAAGRESSRSDAAAPDICRSGCWRAWASRPGRPHRRW